MTSFNKDVSEKLREIALLLEAQHANPFRSRAYINAANTLDDLKQDVRNLLDDEGLNGLIELPGIGAGIARSIYEYVAIGRMTRLESLQGESDPIHLFQSIPTIGRVYADRIHDRLHISSLEALENAVRRGQLDKVEGLGPKRKQAIEAWLSKHLGERNQPLARTHPADHQPDIALVLKVDTEYQSKAEAGKLPMITPRRFNPENKAWLPILHSTYQHWHFTALYSNTERAHKLNRTKDWVVIYFYDDHHHENQNTIVTETHGQLLGKRVVRGREAECFDYYDANESDSNASASEH
jgi:hypothetical protein